MPTPALTLVDQLRRDEAERAYAYDDASHLTMLRGMVLKGNLTIGIGRNLSAKGLSQKERDFLLANDIQDATVALEANFPWVMDLDDVRKEALINMCFNMGVHALSGFTDFLALMKAKDFTAAAADAIHTLWEQQVGPRAQRICLQIQSGFRQ